VLVVGPVIALYCESLLWGFN